MERKDNLPNRVASSSLPHNIAGVGNLTTSSSSSNSSASPPDFLRQIHAALKHRKPLGARPVRVLDTRTKPSKTSSAFAPSRRSNVGKDVDRAFVPVRATRSTKGKPAEMVVTPPVDSSLTPPSVTCTLTDVHEENAKSNHLGQQNADPELFGPEKSSFAAFPSSSELESQVVQASDGLKEFQPFSALSVQQAAERNMVNVDERGFHQQDAQNIDVPISDVPFAGELEQGKEQGHSQHCIQPATLSTLVHASCLTTLSAHSASTFQCIGAPLAGQTTFPTQVSEPVSQNLVGSLDLPHPVGKGVMFTEGPSLQKKQQLHYEDIPKREVADHADCLQSQALSTINSSSKPDIERHQASKTEKDARRKKYDSAAFFCVSGKLYQKLGKIGSGGSSEVHKVISADCTIYALKRIKLKGRDYATTYGFCQEIGYLNKLKGKNNIINLVDYEVTDKTLLQQAMEESLTSREGRIKNDDYIYMVLEYGEIDLAHMLMQKCKDMNGSSWNIDENWLRFYWQQMLEAVNTIHMERIVHSDLKPANFLLVRGSLKLIDFGIAKAIMSDTTNIQRDSQVGTLNYMSPEAFMSNEQGQAGGTIKCGRSSDIWSLGCILYQMVYGKTPFADYKTFWAKFKVITDERHEITYDPVANPWLVDLMKRCLAWDRGKRWRIPQLLQHPFLVPPVPREVPPSQEDHPYELLFHRVELYRDEPQVSRLCSELLCVVSRLERDGERLGMKPRRVPAD